MLKQKDVGLFCHFTIRKDVRFTKEMTDQMERMDEQIEHGISFGVCSCEVMIIVIDKTFLAKTLLQDLNSWSIAFLHTHHNHGRMLTLLKVDERIQFSQGPTGRFLDE